MKLRRVIYNLKNNFMKNFIKTHMKKIIYLASFLIILIGCGYAIIKILKMQEEEAFKKKQVCISYKDNIVKNAKEENIKDGGWRTLIPLDFFYSPKLNTCLYVEESIISTENISQEVWVLKDVLGNKQILQRTIDHKNYSTELEGYEKLSRARADFYNEVEKYK
jgi:hypothetical protein